MNAVRGIILILIACTFHVKGNNECNTAIKQFSVLKDQTGKLAIVDVTAAKNFTASDNLNFSYTDAAYWIRFAAHQKHGENEVFVVPHFRCLDYIDYYFVRKGKVVKSLSTGYLRPLSTREKTMSRLVFSIPEDATEQDSIYVRVQKKEGLLNAQLFFMDEHTLLEENRIERQTLFFYFGVSFIMLVFAFTYFVSFRLNLFLWYMLFVFFGVMHEVSNYGYGNIYIWRDWFWMANISRTLWNAPFIFSALMFSFHLLQVKEFCGKRTQQLFRLMKIVFAILFFIALLPLPAYPWRFSVFILHVILFGIVLGLLLYATWKAMVRKHIPAYFFFTGEMSLLLIVLIIGLRNFKFFPPDLLPSYIFIYMGIVAMSFTLFSMVAYTRQMHIKVVKEMVPVVIKPEPKPLSENELERLNEIFAQVELFIQKEKSFLNADLSLKTFSDESGIAEHLLSKAINIKANMHFFDYINSYRIKEACLLLSDKEANKKYSIEGIAQLCGFANKASFNKAFKKFTGKTPSEFRAGLS